MSTTLAVFKIIPKFIKPGSYINLLGPVRTCSDMFGRVWTFSELFEPGLHLGGRSMVYNRYTGLQKNSKNWGDIRTSDSMPIFFINTFEQAANFTVNIFINNNSIGRSRSQSAAVASSRPH